MTGQKSNLRSQWTKSTGFPEGNRRGEPGDLFYDEAGGVLWIKAFGRGTTLGWRPLVFGPTGSFATGGSLIFGFLETDGAGGFSTLVLDGFSSVVIEAPRDVIFTFANPRPNTNYAVVALGAEGTGGLFINCDLATRTKQGFRLDLFDNANANVNPLAANVTIDVIVTPTGF